MKTRLYELWTPLSQVMLISQSWPRMCSRVHLNFAVVTRFSSLLYFLTVFEILRQPYCWFFIVLAIMIRRLLYDPGYEVSSLNNASLSLQLAENNSQLRINRKIFLEANFSHSKLLHKLFLLLLRDIIVLENFLLSFSQLRCEICTGVTLFALACYTWTALFSANQNRVIFSCILVE